MSPSGMAFSTRSADTPPFEPSRQAMHVIELNDRVRVRIDTHDRTFAHAEFLAV